MIQHAKVDNARLLKAFPKGFALDATHRQQEIQSPRHNWCCHFPYLKKMLAEPFEAFTSSPTRASVYQLGAFGMARKELKPLALTP